MAVITPQLPPLPVAGGAAPGRTDAVYARQWRKALEEAQWAAQRSSGSAADGSPPDGGPVGDAPPPATGPRSGAAAVFDVAPAPRTTNAAPAPHAERAAEAIDTAVRQALAGFEPDAAVAGPGSALLAQAGMRAGTPRALAPVRTLAPWSEPPEWPAVAFQASLTPDGVSVAIRDAALDQAEELALYYRLRGRLQSAGHALAGLVINGHEVAPETPGAADR